MGHASKKGRKLLLAQLPEAMEKAEPEPGTVARISQDDLDLARWLLYASPNTGFHCLWKAGVDSGRSLHTVLSFLGQIQRPGPAEKQ